MSAAPVALRAAAPPLKPAPPPARTKDAPQQPASDWAGLPIELLQHIFALAAAPADPPPLADPPAVPLCARRLPSLAATAELFHAIDGSCRSWRAAAATTPLHVAVGRSAMPTAGAAPALVAFLCRRPLAALLFEAPAQPARRGCSPGAVQRLALAVLGSAELAAAASGCLRLLAVRDFVCSRPLCTLLPRFPALRALSLSGYLVDVGERAPLAAGLPLSQLAQRPRTRCLPPAAPAGSAGLACLPSRSRPACQRRCRPTPPRSALAHDSLLLPAALLPGADLEPLRRLPGLLSLHVEAEGLPSLAALPSSLRHLSLSAFANTARCVERGRGRAWAVRGGAGRPDQRTPECTSRASPPPLHRSSQAGRASPPAPGHPGLLLPPAASFPRSRQGPGGLPQHPRCRHHSPPPAAHGERPALVASTRACTSRRPAPSPAAAAAASPWLPNAASSPAALPHRLLQEAHGAGSGPLQPSDAAAALVSEFRAHPGVQELWLEGSQEVALTLMPPRTGREQLQPWHLAAGQPRRSCTLTPAAVQAAAAASGGAVLAPQRPAASDGESGGGLQVLLLQQAAGGGSGAEGRA